MLAKMTGWFGKCSLFAISVGVIISLSGCGDTAQEEIHIAETGIEVETDAANIQEDSDRVAELCLEFYESAEIENKISDLETIRSIVQLLEEHGYPAVDSKNQIDMANAERVIKFCEKVEAQEKDAITVIVVDDMGGILVYDFQTDAGNVDVTRKYYKYENGSMKREELVSYKAEGWKYTEDGYLMFSGIWFAEELYAMTLSSAEEHVALRVEPLDERYRELNRNYLLPIGYERNNMFLVDWNESDFGELNFYDLYDILCPGIKAEYVTEEDEAILWIPKDDFESVIMEHFNIDSETLQVKAVYRSENSIYEYRARGLYETEYPEYPYSEVVGFAENGDGTMVLKVNVVFPYAGDSNVYEHEVTIRLLDDGNVQYVSNRIVSPKEVRGTWHTDRFTKEKWEEMYREK